MRPASCWFLRFAIVAMSLGAAFGAAPNASPELKFADLPGWRVAYRDSGGSGVPIVLLHANTGTSAGWGPQFSAFSAAGFRVIAFDRRGWGSSIANPDTGPQPGSVAEDLAALVEHLRLPKFHLLGVAGGGFASLDYAAWRPDTLRSLVIRREHRLVRRTRHAAAFPKCFLRGFQVTARGLQGDQSGLPSQPSGTRH